MLATRLWTMATALLQLSIAWCDDKLELGGSLEQFVVVADKQGEFQARERITRILGYAKHGRWQFLGSYWSYPWCDWWELDETHISYETPKLRIRAGRFLLPVGQTNWDDQWYSGFVFLPQIESTTFSNKRLLERTSLGYDAEFRLRNGAVKASLTTERQEEDRVLAGNPNRGSIRYEHYVGDLIIGASAFGDVQRLGRREQMLIADLRHTSPQVTVRGEIVGYRSVTEKAKGHFVDIYFRPRGYSDITFVGRFQGFESSGKYGKKVELETFGGKIRGPWETAIYLNFTFGPGSGKLFMGRGWSLSISKTLRF